MFLTHNAIATDGNDQCSGYAVINGLLAHVSFLVRIGDLRPVFALARRSPCFYMLSAPPNFQDAKLSRYYSGDITSQELETLRGPMAEKIFSDRWSLVRMHLGGTKFGSSEWV